MKKVLFVMALALTMVGCGQKTAQGGDAGFAQRIINLLDGQIVPEARL